MTAAQYQQILAALATLVIALLGYLTVVVRKYTAQLAAQHTTIISQLVRTGALAAARPARAGAGGDRRGAPVWNQLADQLPNGQLPAQRYNECGEECVAMVLYAQHGVAVEADYLRWQLGGPARRGLTTGADLQTLLERNNVMARAQTVPPATLALRLQEITATGRMAIVLGDFDASSVLHWILVTRADTRGAGFNDPWGGVRKAATWAELQPHFDGEIVEILRTADQLA